MKEQDTFSSWANEASKGITKIDELARLNLIRNQSTIENGMAIQKNFDIRVPAEFLNIIDQNGPLQKQFIPDAKELEFDPNELLDPISDEDHTPVKFVTHRYKDRVLLKVSYQCGVYCRYCFRRYKVSDGKENPSEKEMEAAISYISSHPEINEVILTGGDPLSVSDKKLAFIIESLNRIPHLSFLRVHTRMPTAIPSRISNEFLQILSTSKLPIWFVLHINHASELTPRACESIKLLSNAGYPLLCQSVLLKGVNDDVETLKQLSLSLVRNKITPYYLHYPDLAQGTNHFRIPLEKSIELVNELHGKISGFAIPQLIVDLPGGNGKINMTKTMYRKMSNDQWSFISPLSGKEVIVNYPTSSSDHSLT
ncbi:MAG: KamA family radical SAM protein [Bacteriovoracaceae bacterium]|nr:KamA family radical SAM protein [Bacteriovoracaceae bacterium]